MHRTQLLLEDWQYELLRQRAEREQKSLSRLVRELLDQALNSKKKKHSVRELAGIGSDPGFSVRDHDQVLYGDPRGERMK